MPDDKCEDRKHHWKGIEAIRVGLVERNWVGYGYAWSVFGYAVNDADLECSVSTELYAMRK